MTGRIRLPLLAALFLGLLGLQLAARDRSVPWTVDNGNKWILAVAGEGWVLPTLPWPGSDEELGRRFPSIHPPFAHEVDGRSISQYPPLFSLLSRPFLRLAPDTGRFVLPVFGALLAAWGAARLASSLGGSPGWAFLFAGPLGPLGWYGTTFWEHTVVAAAAIWGTVLWFERRRFGEIAAALLFALATAMREETALFALAWIAVTGLAGARATPRSERAIPPRRTLGALRFLAVYAAALLPFAWAQWRATGQVLGLHLQGNVGPVGLDWIWTDRLGTVRRLLWSGDDGTTEAADLLLALGAIGLAFALGRTPPRWIRFRLLGTGALGFLIGGTALGCAFALQREADMPMTLVRTAGLLLFAPWVAFAFAAGARRIPEPEVEPAGSIRTEEEIPTGETRAAGPVRIVVSAAGLGIGLVLLLTPAVTAFGFHWGPRILMTWIPLLAAIAATGLGPLVAVRSPVDPPAAERGGRPPGALRGFRTLGLVFLLLASVALQGYGGHLQARVTRGAAALLERTQALAARGDSMETRIRGAGRIESFVPIPVVTDLWWYAQTFAPLTVARPVYGVRSGAEMRVWVREFGRRGGRRFLLATARPPERLLRGLPVEHVRSEPMEGYPPAYRHELVLVTLKEGLDR